MSEYIYHIKLTVVNEVGDIETLAFRVPNEELVDILHLILLVSLHFRITLEVM